MCPAGCSKEHSTSKKDILAQIVSVPTDCCALQRASKEPTTAEDSILGVFNLFGGNQEKLPRDVGLVGALFLFSMMVFYVFHCCWVSAEMYSAPSIVLQSRAPNGGLHVFDDFREAYGWLRHNTDEEAKVSLLPVDCSG